MSNPIKVVAISDLHGNLPTGFVPEADLLLIAGDICPSPRLDKHGEWMSLTEKALWQSIWLREKFAPWLEKQPVKHTVAVWGNHDWIGQVAPHLTPKDISWRMLTDDYTELLGFKIYGTPWQPVFFDWAFNLPEHELEKKWRWIPSDTDILVLHGPPHGYGDLAPPISGYRKEPEHTGSPSLTAKIKQVKPLLTVYGHIHPGYGVYDLDGLVLANVASLDDHYKLTHAPFVTTLTPRAK